ncbi:DUF4272 domain-containing protein [Archangium lansingense]|uniref:DUF4272 domain-containing protein n=1 Tax=Archangium lansingense TaxID=2995310 RepID=UPI003B81CB89
MSNEVKAMPGNAAIYSPKSQLPSIDALRTAAPGAKVTAASEKERSRGAPPFIITWPDLMVTVNQMPAEQLVRHLQGFQGYLQSRCELVDPELLQRVGGMKQCLGLVVEPDFDEEGRGEALVLALTELVEGVFFAGGAVYAADGSCLAAPPEEFDEDEDEDEEEYEEEYEAQYGDTPPEGARREGPPTAMRVAQRTLVFGALTARAQLEDYPGEDREQRRQWLMRRVEDLGLWPELERDERRILEAPAGTLSRRQTIDSSWRSEGLAVLAWALGVSELPAHDHTMDSAELITKKLGLMGDQPSPVLATPKLRTPEELRRMERRLLALHWRLRDFSLRPQAMDFIEFSRTAWMGPFELEGIQLAGNDLAIGGKPIAQADPQRVRESQSIATERHHAINWLMGQTWVYSLVDTST